jgi:type IV pilus assembly protein PilO
MRLGAREAIFLALVLAVPLAAWWMVFQPRQEQIRAARIEVEEKQEKLQRLSQVSARIEDLRASIGEGRAALEQLERRIPDRSGIDAVLEQITRIAMNHQLVIRSIKGDRPTSAPLYSELPLQISIEGEFDGFYRFLLDLEGLDRITRVHHLRMTRVVEGRALPTDPEPGLRIEMTMSIFFDPTGTAGDAAE